jgi:hypothetical protein
MSAGTKPGPGVSRMGRTFREQVCSRLRKSWMFPKFSLVQLFEITAVASVTLAFDRLPYLLPGSGLLPVLIRVVACGSLTRAYIGIRWSKRRNAGSIAATAAVAAVVATPLNAVRIGVSIAESLRRTTEGAYFSWEKDWHLLATAILVVTMAATLTAPLLSLVLFAVLHPFRHQQQ